MLYGRSSFIFVSSLQDFLVIVLLDPTFHFATCGAEIRHSFGICVTSVNNHSKQWNTY
ncbi:hypothetical protein Barb6_01047 [Bacteroidales bacterium Barb6]|nr:hypothetical protein Barb6_01047 [Bacteroidales bacterium Barb6]